MSRLPLFDMVLGRIVLGVGLEIRPFFMPLKIVLHQQRSSQLVAWTIILKEHICCIDWLEDMIRVLDKRATIDLMTTLWNNWNKRNNFIFHGKEEEEQVVWDRA
ncbi:hypothetical protein Goshw_027208 [Gossypium schwendimanii]|uniref:Uncharacterized protein n=1 Tax=Gossypium schwendimanii TaxID=34291 RepID=A0A7J9M7K5_GOSSC|nr:hypothetical protein [Gossypium schwendimanii]